MKVQSISDVYVEKTDDGYRCKASVVVTGESQLRAFDLLVPVSAHNQIALRLGPDFGLEEVRSLFERRIEQYIANDMLRDSPPGRNVNLGELDYREVDALIPLNRRF